MESLNGFNSPNNSTSCIFGSKSSSCPVFKRKCVNSQAFAGLFYRIIILIILRVISITVGFDTFFTMHS